MIEKIKLTVVQTFSYEPDPEQYPDNFTIQQMAQLDATSSDIELLMYNINSDTINVTWEIVKK